VFADRPAMTSIIASALVPIDRAEPLRRDRDERIRGPAPSSVAGWSASSPAVVTEHAERSSWACATSGPGCVRAPTVPGA